jgi:geranylgeranyl pyrophosphate synthase
MTEANNSAVPPSDSDTPAARLRERVAALSAEIDERLSRFIDELPSDIDNLAEGVRYGLGLDSDDRAVRGKRIRPAMCLLTAEALGADLEQAYPFALGIELMHNFALIHDDFEDGDQTRRGRPAVWVKHGTAHGINIGDYCLAQVFRVLLDNRSPLDAEVRLELLDLMADTLDHTIRGQALDINARDAGEDFNLADYERIVREKTGHYLAAPFLGGAFAAEADEEICGALAQFGHCLGPMYQIMDDAIDLTAAKGRDERGSDIREGKRSFLVAWTLERVETDDRRRLLEILDAPRDATSAAMVDEAETIFEKADAFDAAREQAEELRAEADAAVADLPENLASLLREFTLYLVNRKN